jgi:anaerobic magnesium-protoporphyrin IX monomethyl ester cyclase
MKMKILLINSPYDLMGKGYKSKTKIKRGFFPPLGLGYLATALLKNNIQTEIYDSVVLNTGIKEVLNKISQYNPDVVGLSVMTPGFAESYKLSNAIRNKFNNIIIVFGGPHATSFPEEIMENCLSADYVIAGEGEWSLVQLIKNIDSGEVPHINVSGLYYRTKNEEYLNTSPPVYIKNIDDIDFPARHLLNNELYIPLPNFSKKLPATSMVTSRGCPYRQCKFCFQSGKFSHSYRRRTVKNVIKEIKELVNQYKIKEIAFYDSLFAINEKWIIELCDEIINNKINISWSCFAQIAFTTENMLRKMKEAGCFNIYYGIESGDQELLDYIRKKTTPNKIFEIVKLTHKYEIETRGSFIIGLPKSSPEKDKKTIDFAVKLNLDYAGFFPYRVYKGTQLAEEAHFFGTVIADRAEGHHSATYYPNDYNSVEEVQKMTKYAYRKFYFRLGYFLKVINKIRSFEDLKRVLAGLKLLLGFTS